MMASESPSSTGRDRGISTLDGLIQVLDLAKDACGVPPAQVVFASVSALLTMIRVYSLLFCNRILLAHFIQDSIVNKGDYVKLGLECADICQALDRGLEERRLDELSQSVLGAIQHLSTWVELPADTQGGSSTELSIAELWQRSRGRSSSGVSGARSLDYSMRRTTKILSPVGGKTSTGSFRSSTCVHSVLIDAR